MRRTRRPTFLWQGLLIVLPVVLLAALGLVSLRQDQRLAEQEAQERAQEVLRPLSIHLSHTLGSILGFEALEFSDAGELLQPRDWTPSPLPPPWFRNLSGDLLSAWRTAQGLATRPGGSSSLAASAWEKVLAAEPGPEVRANAEFALLRLRLLTNTLASGVGALADFVKLRPELQTDSGLPIAAVAMALALEQRGTNEWNEDLTQLLREQIRAPSLLTPRFLVEAERRSQANAKADREGVLALRAGWQRDEHRRRLGRLLQERLLWTNQLATNLWLRDGSEQWLAVVFPGRGTNAAPAPPQPEGSGLGQVQIRLLAKSPLERALTESIQSAGVPVPSYAALRADVEGEPLEMTEHGLAEPGSKDGRMLAAITDSFSVAEAGEVGNHGKHEPERRAAARLVRVNFGLRLELAAPQLLYARQRQRSFWFGAVILASATAALVGFVRARGAFLRERQLSELKSNFVSSVSHELRAPIASVRLLAESLERGKVTDASRQHQYFRFIVQECQRLSSLVANVLDFSRIEQGRKEYEFEPTDVGALVRKTVVLMETYAAERGVTVELQEQATDEESQATLDGRALQQALVNLIDNAIKHSPKGAVVTSGWERSGAILRLWVKDRGEGIPEVEHERIFDRFYRCGSELRRETQGVGIGLSIVKHIVQAHGGRVLVESAPGQGSCFTIELPLQREGIS